MSRQGGEQWSRYFFVRNSLTTSEVCAGALLWCNNQFLFFHISGRQYAINPHKTAPSVHNPHKSLQSVDPIWRPVTLLPSAAHSTHCPQPNQQHAGSVVQLSSPRLLLLDILCTITSWNVTRAWRVYLNLSVYMYCIQTFWLITMFQPPCCNIVLNQWVHVKWTPSLFWDNVCCHSDFVEQCLDSVCWSQLQRLGDQKSQE